MSDDHATCYIKCEIDNDKLKAKCFGAKNYLSFLFQKNRSDTPCFFESQPQGCLKPHCPFFHKEPRPAMAGNVAGPPMSINEPPLVQPVNPQPTANVPPNVALPVPQTASPMMASQAGMKIPIISTPPRPRPAMHPRGGMVRPPVTMQYPPASAQPIPMQQPPPMVRNPQFIGPPRPVASMVQPISVGRGFSPLLQGPPGRYKTRGVLHKQNYLRKHNEFVESIFPVNSDKSNPLLM